MSLVASLKSKLGTVSAEIASVFKAIEPDLEAIAASEAGKVLAKVAAELPALEVKLAPALLASGIPAAQATAIASALIGTLGPWLTSTLTKVAPPVPMATSTPVAAAPVSQTPAAKTTP